MRNYCCRHCGLLFEELNRSERANHSRWCEKNPKREQYLKNTARMRAGINEESKKKQALGISKAHAEGKYDHVNRSTSFAGKTHTEETKKLISKKARASKHRRLRRKMIEYKGIMLDSSWELFLAKRLDEQNIRWLRPDPIEWFDEEGKQHHYFPDFYLPDYDLFLDPKNDYAYKVQEKKIEHLKKVLTNLVILSNIEDIKRFIPTFRR